MLNVREVYNYINSVAPFSSALNFDNSGFLAGDPLQKVKKILLSLDITSEVVAEAESLGADLIISHHPVIFKPIKKVLSDNVVYSLIKKGISAICAHTNLDTASGGVNDVLADLIGLVDIEPFSYEDEENIGRVGYIDMQPVDDFAAKIKKILNAGCVRFTEGGCPVNRVALIGGSGGDYIDAAVACEADTFLTGEMKYHQFLYARQVGINVIEAGHYATEFCVLTPLREKLIGTFENIEVVISLENKEQPCVV